MKYSRRHGRSQAHLYYGTRKHAVTHTSTSITWNSARARGHHHCLPGPIRGRADAHIAYTGSKTQGDILFLVVACICQQIIRKPARILSRMAQTPQTEYLARLHDEAFAVALVVRTLYCVPTLNVKQKKAFRMCDTIFFWYKKTSGYQRVSILKLFWALRQPYIYLSLIHI